MRRRLVDAVTTQVAMALLFALWVGRRTPPRPQCPGCVLALNHFGKHGPSR